MFVLFSRVDSYLLSKNKSPPFKQEFFCFFFENIDGILPSKYHLSTHEATANEISTFTLCEGKGQDYKDLVRQKSSSILSVVCLEDDKFVPTNLKLYLKDGGDGPGCMPKLKSAKCDSNKEHIFQYGIIPLKATVKDDKNDKITEWEN